MTCPVDAQAVQAPLFPNAPIPPQEDFFKMCILYTIYKENSMSNAPNMKTCMLTLQNKTTEMFNSQTLEMSQRR